MQRRKPPLTVQPTTLWDYPSQHYGGKSQGSARYRGATPSYVIWNLLSRYTREGDLVVDPMCDALGPGTFEWPRRCFRSLVVLVLTLQAAGTPGLVPLGAPKKQRKIHVFVASLGNAPAPIL